MDKYLQQKSATARGIVTYKSPPRIVDKTTVYFDYVRKEVTKSYGTRGGGTQPATYKPGNIESSMVKMVRDGLKSFFKGIGQKDFVYEHGGKREFC